MPTVTSVDPNESSEEDLTAKITSQIRLQIKKAKSQMPKSILKKRTQKQMAKAEVLEIAEEPETAPCTPDIRPNASPVEEVKHNIQETAVCQDEEDGVTIFRCKFPGCGQTYTKSASIGGHTSKKHPGFSQVYKKKQETRARRELKREQNHLLKEFFDNHGITSAYQLSYYKKEIRKHLSDEAAT